MKSLDQRTGRGSTVRERNFSCSTIRMRKQARLLRPPSPPSRGGSRLKGLIHQKVGGRGRRGRKIAHHPVGCSFIHACIMTYIISGITAFLSKHMPIYVITLSYQCIYYICNYALALIFLGF